MALKNNLGEQYSPFYFLSSLGAGGLSVSFFLYLMMMTPHPNTPIPTFDTVFSRLGISLWETILIIIASIGVLYFAFLHIKLLVWNVKEYGTFKNTHAFKSLKSTNAEVTLMAVPLTYAMTINVCFAVGAVFVPGLWDVVEYLFPFAILGFFAVGVYALRVFGEYFTRLFVEGNFDFSKNNNLSQMIAIFAFSMISVGFAAPGAMSHIKEVAATALFFSIFFATIALFLIVIKLSLGIKSILRQGVSKETSVSLWIMIPILTLLGIAFLRMTHGFAHGFSHAKPDAAWLFLLTSGILSAQIMFGLIGYYVMKRLDYFKDYISGDIKAPSTFAIVCPGVALFVFGLFFINTGLVSTGLMDKFSLMYFVFTLPFVYVQYLTIKVYFRLSAKNLVA